LGVDRVKAKVTPTVIGGENPFSWIWLGAVALNSLTTTLTMKVPDVR
jgi:hypothetical protein